MKTMRNKWRLMITFANGLTHRKLSIPQTNRWCNARYLVVFNAGISNYISNSVSWLVGRNYSEAVRARVVAVRHCGQKIRIVMKLTAWHQSLQIYICMSAGILRTAHCRNSDWTPVPPIDSLRHTQTWWRRSQCIRPSAVESCHFPDSRGSRKWQLKEKRVGRDCLVAVCIHKFKSRHNCLKVEYIC